MNNQADLGRMIREHGETLRSPQLSMPPIAVEDRCKQVLADYGDEQQFSELFSPEKVYTYCSYPERCFDPDNKAPSLTVVKAAYGRGADFRWLLKHVESAVSFCETDGKLMPAAQLNEITLVLRTQGMASRLKVTEWMYFFYGFKASMFGKVYGQLTPKAFTEAFQEFLIQRNHFIDRVLQIKAEIRQAQMEEELKNAISYEEFLANRDK